MEEHSETMKITQRQPSYAPLKGNFACSERGDFACRECGEVAYGGRGGFGIKGFGTQRL